MSISTITTEDGSELFYKDWARARPWCSATAGR
jgi:hypothetical protein